MSFASPTVNSGEPFPLMLLRLFGELERSVKTCHISFNHSKTKNGETLHGAWQRAT